MASLLKNIKAAPSAKELKAKSAPAKKLVKTSKGETVVATHDIHNKPFAPKTAPAKKSAPAAALDKAVAKAVKAGSPVVVNQPVTPPKTPLTEAFVKAGFVFNCNEDVDDRTVAHGYTHEDGSVAVFVHAGVSTDVGAKWAVTRADGTKLEGKTAKEFVKAIYEAKAPAKVSAHVMAALELLKKLTNGSFRVADLTGDGNYTNRVQLLKKLLNTSKVLAKDAAIGKVVPAFYTAVGATGLSPAARASDFSARCVDLLKSAARTTNAVRRTEKAEIANVLKQTAHLRTVGVDQSKPILDAPKKMNKKQEAKDSENFKLELAARVKRAERETAAMPMAAPKSDADIYVNLDEIFLLEDPNNGIVILQLEKPNSQGAICVYNNGSRVAAGVVPTEVLRTMRQLVSSDLVRDVNQLLHPITAGVVVSPVAERHLTAVLDHCKENIMTTATPVETKKQKFAPPAGAAAKKTAKNNVVTKVKATVTKKAAAKKGATPRADRKIKALVTLKSEGLPREGSFCYGQVEAIIGSKTISEAQAKLDKSKLNPSGRKLEVAWLVKNGYLQVTE